MELFDNKELNRIHTAMQRRNQTVAVAESVTAGLLQLTIAQVEEASGFYQGGISVYNLGQKYRHLQVEPIHAQAVNCVSEKVSDEMALNVCRLFSSDWGIAVTGYATPVPESGNETFAFYAIAYQQKIVTRKKISLAFTDAFDLQRRYVKAIIDDFLQQLEQ